MSPLAVLWPQAQARPAARDAAASSGRPGPGERSSMSYVLVVATTAPSLDHPHVGLAHELCADGSRPRDRARRTCAGRREGLASRHVARSTETARGDLAPLPGLWPHGDLRSVVCDRAGFDAQLAPRARRGLVPDLPVAAGPDPESGAAAAAEPLTS